MKTEALHVLGKRIPFENPVLADDTGDGRVPGGPLLLHQEFERAIAPRDVLGKLLDGLARLHAADVAVRQHQLFERDVPRPGQGNPGGLGHVGSL